MPQVDEIARLLAQVADPFNSNPITCQPFTTPTPLCIINHNPFDFPYDSTDIMPVPDTLTHEVPASPEVAATTLPTLSTIAQPPTQLVPFAGYAADSPPLSDASAANSPYATSSSPATPCAESEEDEAGAATDQETALQRLTVEELRAELRSRRAAATGRKAELQGRLRRLLKRRGASPVGARRTRPTATRAAPRAGNAARKGSGAPCPKRKRPHTRKEPGREDFASLEEYEAAWSRWREVRDNNNQSVKRSREVQRQRRLAQQEERAARERENDDLERRLWGMKKQVAFLARAVATPCQLTDEDWERLYEVCGRDE